MKIKQLAESLTEKEIAQIIYLKEENSLNKIIEEIRELNKYKPFNQFFLEENKVIDLNRLFTICISETKLNNFYFKNEVIDCLLKNELMKI